MFLIVFLSLLLPTLQEEVEVLPSQSYVVQPSPHGDSLIVCTYDYTVPCETECILGNIYVADNATAPESGSFSVIVERYPIIISNEKISPLDCEIIRPNPVLSLEESEISNDDQDVETCPTCEGMDESQDVFIAQTIDSEVICKGTQITAKNVLTTAECISTAFGPTYIANSSMSWEVSSFIIHPFYDTLTQENNLAILTLQNTRIFKEPPCICHERTPWYQFESPVFPSLNFAKNSLCPGIAKTDLCATLQEPDQEVSVSELGTGLYIPDEKGSELLCGMLTSGKLKDTELLDTSAGFTVLKLRKFYKWIYRHVDIQYCID